MTRIELADAEPGSTRVTITLTHEPKRGRRLVQRIQHGALRRLVRQTLDAEPETVPSHISLAVGSA